MPAIAAGLLVPEVLHLRRHPLQRRWQRRRRRGGKQEPCRGPAGEASSRDLRSESVNDRGWLGLSLPLVAVRCALFAFRHSLLAAFAPSYCHPERGAKRRVEGPAFLTGGKPLLTIR